MKYCKFCNAELVKRENEQTQAFKKRQYCNRRCWGDLQSQKVYRKGKEDVRIQGIIQGIQNGKTQIQLGRELGISREWVRQIWKKYGEVEYSELKNLQKKEEEREKKEALEKLVKFSCFVCHTPVHFPSQRQKYCEECGNKQIKSNIRYTQIRICYLCQNTYFAYSSSNTTLVHRFCHKNHYFRYKAILKENRLQYKERLTELYYLKLKVRKMEKELAKYRQKEETEQEQLKEKKYNTCKKCHMLLTDEYVSKIDVTLCYGCDGSEYEEEQNLMRSGLIQTR